METVILKVAGMSCGHCVQAVQKAITAVDGAQPKQVAIGSVTVEFDPARTNVAALIDAVDDAGYEAQEAT